jgi:hypothetical protein
MVSEFSLQSFEFDAQGFTDWPALQFFEWSATECPLFSAFSKDISQNKR